MGESLVAAKEGPKVVETNDPSPSLPYVCVHCNTPCAALYRRLSVSLSSIKATTCVKCEKLVDPYIEQEWLLVAIDCILMREEAYRHVLNNVDELKSLPLRTMAQIWLGWSLVDGYLKWQSINGENMGSLLRQDKLFQLAPLAITSGLGILFQWYIMQLFQTRREKDRGNSVRLFWALLLPSCFSIVTIFVSIWENAHTVRMLGSLLIAYWQRIAVGVITNDLSTPALGFVAGILWRFMVSLLFVDTVPCTGFELEVLGDHYRLCLT